MWSLGRLSIWSLPGTLKLRSFLGSDQMDNLLRHQSWATRQVAPHPAPLILRGRVFDCIFRVAPARCDTDCSVLQVGVVSSSRNARKLSRICTKSQSAGPFQLPHLPVKMSKSSGAADFLCKPFYPRTAPSEDLIPITLARSAFRNHHLSFD